MKKYHRVLTIAGSDSGGGAGIQADLKTFSALGCYGMSVLTALTAQNTKVVTAIHPVPTEFICQQIDAVLEDIGVDSVKIGMLHSSEVIITITEGLKRHGVTNIVVDPVMVSKSGDKLLRQDAVGALIEYLLPIATLITPNLPESAVLLNRSEDSIGDDIDYQIKICKELARFTSKAVLLKGGHLTGEKSIDLLYLKQDSSVKFFESERIETFNTHGTGCTLSSAIASYLARGEDIELAVEKAKIYITDAIKAGAEYKLGKGHGPVHHFYGTWK